MSLTSPSRVERLLSEDEVNAHVGRRLRRRRRLVGMTQMALATGSGLRFQQIQKYECGANRMVAARLYTLAQTLQVPVQYFFDGLPSGVAANDQHKVDEALTSNESRALIEAYYQLPVRARRRLLEFARAFSDPTGGGE